MKIVSKHNHNQNNERKILATDNSKAVIKSYK